MSGANTDRMARNPSNGSIEVSSPSSMPPMPASPMPAKLMSRATRSGSMPLRLAKVGLSATARIALPVRVKARKANTDIITIRVATTTDGIHFTDLGAASGLQDPTSTAFNGIRWLGSGSVIALSNGHYGLFFGAGNCLDNDSDGFHFIGYAETVAEVDNPSDLLNWTVFYGFDNPILSTDTVTDPTTGTKYPANPPLIDVTGADVLTPAQVSPWVPPTGHNTNFFSGRVYDPQAISTDRRTVTIVFAGYNTPQPSSNLGDYRTIGRFQLRFPAGYLEPSLLY